VSVCGGVWIAGGFINSAKENSFVRAEMLRPDTGDVHGSRINLGGASVSVWRFEFY
jgi:hypothetical protein